jgi:glycosyltransferase involved in cell wall biosynthesis
MLLGYVTDNELKWLYKNCLAFIYPSLYEGFGLPVLEAMSLGAAVVVSNNTSLLEVAESAAHYIDPYHEKDIFEAFKLLSDNTEYRYGIKRASIDQASKFSWIKCAKQVIDIYKNLTNPPEH